MLNTREPLGILRSKDTGIGEGIENLEVLHELSILFVRPNNHLELNNHLYTFSSRYDIEIQMRRGIASKSSNCISLTQQISQRYIAQIQKDLEHSDYFLILRLI